MAKFPDKLFVKREKDNNGPDYFSNYENINDTTTTGEKVKIGVYQLKELREVIGITTQRKIRR